MQIAKNTVARFEYTLTNDQGEIIDTSRGGEPLSYLHGAGNLIPGLEGEMEGKAVGDSFTVRILPENGYGERNDNLIHDVPRSDLPTEVELQVGLQFQAESEQGTHLLTVIEIGEETVKLDENHPLAGVNLNFDIEIVEVREATSEELSHGHVHEPGDHPH